VDENMPYLQMPSAQSPSGADGALPVRMGVERMIFIGAKSDQETVRGSKLIRR
jgi:hypothetical protein